MVGNIGLLASHLSHLIRYHRPQKAILPKQPSYTGSVKYGAPNLKNKVSAHKLVFLVQLSWRVASPLPKPWQFSQPLVVKVVTFCMSAFLPGEVKCLSAVCQGCCTGGQWWLPSGYTVHTVQTVNSEHTVHTVQTVCTVNTVHTLHSFTDVRLQQAVQPYLLPQSLATALMDQLPLTHCSHTQLKDSTLKHPFIFCFFKDSPLRVWQEIFLWLLKSL